MVFAVEIGGRWGSQPATFLRLLARARAACAHAAVRSASVSRWGSIIVVASQKALASSLLEVLLDTAAPAAGEPAMHEVLQDERLLRALAPGRLLSPRRGVDCPRKCRL